MSDSAAALPAAALPAAALPAAALPAAALPKTTDCYQDQVQIFKAMVMRQTNYSDEEALQKLAEHHNNVQGVVREYLTGSAAVKVGSEDGVRSVNQMIYKEIRTMMDDAAKTYNENKK